MKQDESIVTQWKQVLQGNVLAFGLVSFFTDFSTEMIYPLLPVFFSGLMPSAAAAVYVGLMEGLSESIASLLKFYSGRFSDRMSRRKPLTLAGYAISSFIRPFTAIATAGWHVTAFRVCDRIGKGIRTAPARRPAKRVGNRRGQRTGFQFSSVNGSCRRRGRADCGRGLFIPDAGRRPCYGARAAALPVPGK